MDKKAVLQIVDASLAGFVDPRDTYTHICKIYFYIYICLTMYVYACMYNFKSTALKGPFNVHPHGSALRSAGHVGLHIEPVALCRICRINLGSRVDFSGIGSAKSRRADRESSGLESAL